MKHGVGVDTLGSAPSLGCLSRAEEPWQRCSLARPSVSSRRTSVVLAVPLLLGSVLPRHPACHGAHIELLVAGHRRAALGSRLALGRCSTATIGPGLPRQSRCHWTLGRMWQVLLRLRGGLAPHPWAASNRILSPHAGFWHWA